MIQRVQTLYLLLATIFTGLLLFVPLASSDISNMHADLTAWGIYVTDMTNNGLITQVLSHSWFGILLTVTTLLPFATIFLYKNRKRQMLLCIVEIILLAVSAGLLIYLQQTDMLIEGMAQPKFVLLSQSGLLLLSIVSVWIARRRITKDEALVRSLDRIR